MQVHKKYVAVIGAAVLVTAVGCGGSSSGGKAATNTPSSSAAPSSSSLVTSGAAAQLAPYLKPPTQLVVTAPLSKTPPSGKNFYFISNGIPTEQAIAKGLKDASAILGWKLHVLTASDANPTTYNSQFLAAINAGADAVAIDSISTQIYKQALGVAKQKHVVFLDLASGNPVGTPGVTASISRAGTAGVLWGRIMGLGVLASVAQTNKPAHMLEISTETFASILHPIDDSAKATLLQYCSSCTYKRLDVSFQDFVSGKIPGDVISALQRDPSINYLGFGFSGLETGTTAALASAGLSSKVKIFGVAPDVAQFKELQSHTSNGWVVDPTEVEGWMAADAAARAFVGDDPTVYNSASMPSMLATPENNAPQLIPVDFQSQFKQMWHK